MYDVAIIGGGINGCGCAADASLRGLSVFLCEQGDIASQTSSRSSQFIHGGLRYLEHYDLTLVKKALDEQQILMNVAPHLVHPLPFVLPCDPNGRPQWLLQAGLFLYDHLSHTNELPHRKHLYRQEHETYFEPLNHSIKESFLFYDCITNDARLTLVNALQAQQHQAHIETHTTLIDAKIKNNCWELLLESAFKGTYTIQAKAVINAAGPWIQPVGALLQIPLEHHVSLVKGSHLVVHKLYEGDHAYLLQSPDQRIIFVIPYYGYSLVGTTDVPYDKDLKDVSIEPEEITYLSSILQHAFKKPLNPADVITSWSGVRTLISPKNPSSQAQASTLSRDYEIHFSHDPAPAVTIYGGKITTYRQLAQQAIDTLQIIFPNLSSSKTQYTRLPGSDFVQKTFLAYQRDIRERYHWLEEDILTHYLRTYGTLTNKILQNCHAMDDLGLKFTSILYQREVDYLIQHEWSTCLEDILWRRTKLGLCFDAEDDANLMNYLSNHSRLNHNKK